MAGNIRINPTIVLIGLFITLIFFTGACMAQEFNTPQPDGPGYYFFPSYLEVFPPDALAGGMRPLRPIVPWETGSLIRVFTQISHFEEGRPFGRVGLSPTESPGFAQAFLRPGTYQVSITINNNKWQWADRPPFENFRGHYLIKETLLFSYETTTYILEVPPAPERPHPCDDTEIREGLRTPEAENLREVIAAAVAGQGAQIGPEHVVIDRKGRPATDPGFDMLTFKIPLQMTDNQPRHNINCLFSKMKAGEIEPGTLIGAGEIIFGMVQQIGGQTRLTMRRVEVETSSVLGAGMSTVDGTGIDALNQAAAEAAADALSGVPFF